MSCDDPLPAQLARLLDELAGADAAAVLDEARAHARDRVRARLAEELTRRMLEQLPTAQPSRVSNVPPAPPAARDAGPRVAAPKGRDSAPTAPVASARASGASPRPDELAPSTAVYVYAVAEAGAGPPTEGIRGVGDAAVRVLTSDATGLEALVSDVPLEQFGDEALKHNLNDLPWLSAAALRHEATVEAAMAGTTLVPLRMCTIFRDDDAVREMLAREAPALAAALARLRDAHEWGVKVIADTDMFAASLVREREAASAVPARPAAGQGADYFAALRRDRATREEVAAELDRTIRQVHDAVAALATDVRLHPASSRELSGYEGDMVLNGAYLVPAERTDELRALTRALAD